jgi:hypothetical protein
MVFEDEMPSDDDVASDGDSASEEEFGDEISEDEGDNAHLSARAKIPIVRRPNRPSRPIGPRSLEDEMPEDDMDSEEDADELSDDNDKNPELSARGLSRFPPFPKRPGLDKFFGNSVERNDYEVALTNACNTFRDKFRAQHVLPFYYRLVATADFADPSQLVDEN